MHNINLSLLRLIDGWAGEENQSDQLDFQVDWVRIVPFILVHLGCLAIIWVGFSRAALYACAVMYLVRMFAITAFYHRYFSHRAFRTSRTLQYILAVVANSTAQRGPLWWAAHHRHHHRHSDTALDVHSPGRSGIWHSHAGWIICRQNFGTRKQLVKDFLRYPELVFLDRFDYVVPFIAAAMMFALGSWLAKAAPHLGTDGPQMLVWGFLISTVAVFHATCAINSVAHLWGRRRYDNPDESRNNWLLSLLTLGEGWHNNHHRFPGRAKHGVAWWEVDVTYFILKQMARLGLSGN
jgi:stearoyl-CoA desaturase (delta-9 desaturase)